jgi:hypothetical protein
MGQFRGIRGRPYPGARSAVWEVLWLWRKDRPRLEDVLVNHPVSVMVVKPVPKCAWITETRLGLAIVLRPDRGRDWLLDFAHELGHLHTTRFGGCVPSPNPDEDEIFSEHFAHLWVKDWRHRLQAEMLFQKLISFRGYLFFS